MGHKSQEKNWNKTFLQLVTSTENVLLLTTKFCKDQKKGFRKVAQRRTGHKKLLSYKGT